MENVIEINGLKNEEILKSEDGAFALKAFWKNNKYYQETIEGNGKLPNLNINK